VAQRNGTDPNTKMNWMGFRCARDVKEGAEGQQAEAK
jgi:iron(II)-dependent oxidoreductase